jgi:hypothetical protein
LQFLEQVRGDPRVELVGWLDDQIAQIPVEGHSPAVTDPAEEFYPTPTM